jgi:hypothetical protein
MRLLFAQHLDPSLRQGFENFFNRDLKEEIITMTRVSIKSALKFYSDIHLYCDKESEKHYNDLPITLHELKTTPEFFCGAKLEVLEDQKDCDFIWVDPDIFISTKFNIKDDVRFMYEKSTTLNDKYYNILSYFSKNHPEYPMVREWLNAGLLWFKDREVLDYHINLYKELMTKTLDARIVETWNLSHCATRFTHYEFRLTTEYLHFDGYKKFFGISRDMIKQLDLYL